MVSSERTSGAWVVNLSRHVEPRLQSPWRPLGLLITGLLVSFALGLSLLAGGP